MISKFLAATATGLTVVAMATSAFAQAAPLAKPAAAPQITHGAAIPGFCVFSSGAIRASSATGKAMDARLKALQATAVAPITAREKALQARIEAFNAAAKTPATDINAREKQKSDLEVEQNALQRDASHTQLELLATANVAQQQYGNEMEPAVIAAYQQKQCGMLVERNSVAIYNPAMDISAQVSALLDARGKAASFQSFERTKLTPQQAAQLAQELQRN
jgi:Skp family chaperone for outer membrane proteins